MSIAEKKQVSFTIDGKEVQAKEGIPILEAAQSNGFQITNLCYNRKLKPFAACRTCMVEKVDADGNKKLVYSCTEPCEEGMKVQIHTEETDRYNNSCLEMLLVEHPLDCPICDKSGICPLQDNTEAMGIHDGRFEIKRRNEPSIKSNPLIELYLNRCIMCGMCVRVCDETQGVHALDFHQRGYSVVIGTANEEPLDCEFCGQCITVCPTGALNDLSSQARGLAALFKTTQSICNFCSWGCTVKLETKGGQLIRIEADETRGLGINDGNLCAKGRFGHGFIQHEKRIQKPMANVGGQFKEISWNEAIQTIADRLQSTVNRGGAQTIAGVCSEKITNEESYLFQKLFREVLGSNQVTNLQNLQAPYINKFMVKCFENGIASKPITELEHADVVLIFNSDLPSEYPVGGNSVRKGAVFSDTDLIIANPRNVIFQNEAKVEVRLPFELGSDMVIINRMSRIILDKKLVDVDKVRSAVPNFSDWENSLSAYTEEFTEEKTGLKNEVVQKAAENFAKPADRFVLIGNDVLENNQGEDVLNALLNLAILVHHSGKGSVSIYPPREHCNTQGCNDMGATPQFLPGYKPATQKNNPAEDLIGNCKNGIIKALYITGEDPIRSYYQGSEILEALKTVPFLIVQDLMMTETAQMADIILPTTSYAEKEGTFTNMTRHVQQVTPAVLPEGSARADLDIFLELAEALNKPFDVGSIEEIQDEISKSVPLYQGMFPGNKFHQWNPSDAFPSDPKFSLTRAYQESASKADYPYKLLTNNHMFHIGSYTQYAKALTDVGSECIAQVNRKDAQVLKVKTGDKIRIESEHHHLELPIEVNGITAQGMIYVPKNWPEHPVNLFRNGDSGFVSIKASKADKHVFD